MGDRQDGGGRLSIASVGSHNSSLPTVCSTQLARLQFDLEYIGPISMAVMVHEDRYWACQNAGRHQIAVPTIRLAQVIQKVEAVEAAGVAPGRVKLRVTMTGSFATVVV